MTFEMHISVIMPFETSFRSCKIYFTAKLQPADKMINYVIDNNQWMANIKILYHV